MSLGPSASYFLGASESSPEKFWNEIMNVKLLNQGRRTNVVLFPLNRKSSFTDDSGAQPPVQMSVINNCYKFSAKHKNQQCEGSRDWTSISRLRTESNFGASGQHIVSFCSSFVALPWRHALWQQNQPSLWPEELGPPDRGEKYRGKDTENGTLNSLCKLSMSLTNSWTNLICPVRSLEVITLSSEKGKKKKKKLNKLKINSS